MILIFLKATRLASLRAFDVDLDSFTSSVLFSYIRSTFPPPKAFSPTYVPFLNIPRSGVRLRAEVAAVCVHAGIRTESLLTLDDLPNDLITSQRVRWLLVDHNKLTGKLEEVPQSHVLGAIDHHVEEDWVSRATEPEPRIIEKAGSCTSLVTRYCRSAWDEISSASLGIGAAHGQGEAAINDSAFTQVWDAKAAKLGLASILIDTTNLTASDKVEQADRDAVEYLETRIMMSRSDAGAWDRKAFYEEINRAKKDLDRLTLPEILIKDYKQWTENGLKLGVSSVVKDLSYLSRKAEKKHFDAHLDDFMKDKELDVFAAMSISKTKEGKRRQILLQSGPRAGDYIEKFEKRVEGELKLSDLEVDGFQASTGTESGPVKRKAWWQSDISKSRKQVAPLLREVLH